MSFADPTRIPVRAWIAMLLLSAGTVACGAGSREPPVLAPLRELPEKVPVVLVPGITGSELRERESGELAWGAGKNILFPRDGGYALGLPLEPEPGAEPRLVPGEAIESVRLAWLEKPVYGPIAELLEANGYRRGDLAAPAPDEDLYLFSYDWRRDNVEAVRFLFERLEALRRVRGEDRLAVALVCQSNGGHICRYLAKYGPATLDEAEAGLARPPETLEITRILFVGTANGGSIRILREVDRGRSYAPLVGRELLPEVLFTFPSIFQDLPAYREDLFLDVDGEAMAVDLYKPESWRTYGWSVFGKKARRRLAKAPPELFGDEEARWRHLEENLARAKRFQAVLVAEAPAYRPGRYYLIQNVYRQTPERAVLLREKGRWKTYFTGDRKLRKKTYLLALASAPGDDHATLASQLWLSPKERAAIAAPAFYLDDGHFDMILERGTHRRILDFLLDE